MGKMAITAIACLIANDQIKTGPQMLCSALQGRGHYEEHNPVVRREYLDERLNGSFYPNQTS